MNLHYSGIVGRNEIKTRMSYTSMNLHYSGMLNT